MLNTSEKLVIPLILIAAFSAPVASQSAFDLFIDSTLDSFVKTTSDVTENSGSGTAEDVFTVQTQEEFNQGTFNGTSVDRKDNSGGLGIGYLNGTGSGQANENGLNNDSLVCYWRMDSDISDGGTVNDYSGQGNEGTAEGEIIESNGIFSTDGYEFDGGDEVAISSYSVDHKSFTVVAWVKTNALDNSYRRFFESRSSANDKGYAIGLNTDNRWSFYSNDGSGQDLETSKLTVKDEWVFIAGKYNGETDNKSLYLNGKVEASITKNIDPDNTGKSTIGNDPHFTEPWNGKIDEVRIYNRSLSTGEIEKLYFQGMNGEFIGNYTRSIDTSSEQNWSKLEVDASVPSQTSLDVEFRAKDSSGTTLETDSFTVDDTLKNYSLNVQDSQDAEVFFNGTSDNVTKTWQVNDFAIYSKETVSGGGEVTWNRWS